MAKFDSATPGEYDPDTGRMETARILLTDVTPAEFALICEGLKDLCKTAEARGDPENLNLATAAVNRAEFPVERRKRRVKEKSDADKQKKFYRSEGDKVPDPRLEKKAKAQSAQKVMKFKIVEFIKGAGPSSKLDIRHAVIGKATAEDKEYTTFMTAFGTLSAARFILRTSPDEDADWKLNETQPFGLLRGDFHEGQKLTETEEGGGKDLAVPKVRPGEEQ